MNPQEAKRFGYNLDAITGNALREKELAEATSRLPELFGGDTESVLCSNLLKQTINHDTIHIVSGIPSLLNPDLLELSQPFDDIQNAGVALQSRIARAKLANTGDQRGGQNGDIYFLTLMGEDQRQVDVINCVRGVICMESGETVYVELEHVDPSGEDRSDFWRFSTLTPEQQYELAAEFKKALAKNQQQ